LNALLFTGTGIRVGALDAGLEVGSKGGASSSILMCSPWPRAQETTDRKRGALYLEVKLKRLDSGRKRGVLGAWLLVQLHRVSLSSISGGDPSGDSVRDARSVDMYVSATEGIFTVEELWLS
jgi:hypothetical protein